MDRSFARKKQQELQGESLGLREAQADEANKHRDRTYDLQQENNEHAREMREKNYTLAQASNKRVTANQAAAAVLAKSADSRATEKHASSMSIDKQNREINDIEMKDEAARRRLQGKLATGNFDLDDEDFDASDHLGLDWSQFIDQRGVGAINHLEKVMNPEETGVGLRDPETIESFGYVFQKRINASVGQKTKDGKTITSSRLIDAYPTEDGKFLSLELELTLDDNSTYEADVSKNRSTAEDDGVLLIPIEKAMDQVQGRVMINRALQGEGNAENRAKLKAAIERRLGSNKPQETKLDLEKRRLDLYKSLSRDNSKEGDIGNELTEEQLWQKVDSSMQRASGAKTSNPPPVPGARQAPDGKWYVESKDNPGKFERVDQ